MRNDHEFFFHTRIFAKKLNTLMYDIPHNRIKSWIVKEHLVLSMSNERDFFSYPDIYIC